MKTQTIKFMTENMEEFNEYVEKIAKQYLDLNEIRYQYIENIDVSEYLIELTVQVARCSCCNELEGESFPTNYLWDDDWQMQAKEKILQLKEQIEIQKQATEHKRKVDRENREREQYAKLRKKFEGETL